MKFEYFTIDQVRTLLKKQGELDEFIRGNHDISVAAWNTALESNHRLALQGEISEFINECRDVWKYWKKAAVNHMLLLDEGVDVLHFCLLLLNKRGVNEHVIAMMINDEIKYQDNKNGDEIKPIELRELYILNDFSAEDICKLFGQVVALLYRYNNPLTSILEGYDKKYQENFERQQHGY